MSRDKNETNSFSIARYILFLVLGLLCIGIGIWSLTSSLRRVNAPTADTVTLATN